MPLRDLGSEYVLGLLWVENQFQLCYGLRIISWISIGSRSVTRPV